jgi:hypothetical protein
MKKTLVLPAVQVSSSGSLAPAHSDTNLPLVKHSIVLAGLLKHAQSRRGWLRAVLALAAPLALAVPAAPSATIFSIVQATSPVVAS